ncbi:tryptophan 7-halogenase [Arenicella sp. 4NH20-0111]|uniref:tryptophan halogenase family protein n=1 Tax=Arenicella sp. 4NH20-0111 TaxID=3127648 RepID=UPI00310A902E
MDKKIKKVVVLGGGTAGWMVASSLVTKLDGLGLKVTVIDSSKVEAIGVGEATLPSIRSFCSSIGIEEIDLMRSTKATCKLGVEFIDWSKRGQSFFHPFGLYGTPFQSVDFYHYWLRLFNEDKASSLEHYSLAAVLAKSGRFTRPVKQPSSELSVFDWALHFDAGLFATVLKDHAIARGAVCLDLEVVDAELDPNTGDICKLVTDGMPVFGDLFVDCSGFKSLLIGKALGVEYEDWSNLLPTDSAIVSQCANKHGMQPYTQSTALEFGWKWRIPLQDRVGNGFVYSSSHCCDDIAEETFRNSLEGELLTSPSLIRFKAGRRKKAWYKNVVSIGLSAGFVEPLESTSISLIETAIDRLLRFFPRSQVVPGAVEEFNYRTQMEIENIRDFIILHYAGSSRTDSEFWNDFGSIHLPSSLEARISLFRESGILKKYEWESFHEPSWLTMFTAFGVLPQTYHPLVDAISKENLVSSLSRMKASLLRSALEAPSHPDFLIAYGVMEG